MRHHYHYDENEQAAYSNEEAKWYTLGDKIRIVVHRVNIEELFIDFLPASEFDNALDDRDIIDSRDFLKKKGKNKKEIYSRKSKPLKNKSRKEKKKSKKKR